MAAATANVGRIAWSKSPSFPPAVLAAGLSPELTARVHSQLQALGHADSLESSAVSFRAILPRDRKEVEALHREWFPVSYPAAYFEEICSAPESLETLAAVLKAPVKTGSRQASAGGETDILVGMVVLRLKWKQPRFDMDSVMHGGTEAVRSRAGLRGVPCEARAALWLSSIQRSSAGWWQRR
eukprot:TRINITY_DN20835_c0_g1_i8.p1 TRINITY_DN20835_c0_g1~~TRINITY_DN20835_c0_g1_i8.p1  ORF type:complete len:183 (-),score=32.88 TRINITY_DN20835_c0_g1_i8:74-622(-)